MQYTLVTPHKVSVMVFRSAFALSIVALGMHAQTATPPCTGLCLQQVQCPAGTSTTVTGTVYAPNNTDPIPNVTVYIPNAPVDAFTPGVSCPVPGQLPSGSPLVGAFSAADGTFTLSNVPVGNDIPIVIIAGKWRRQMVIPGTAACQNTTFNLRFPKNQSEGDIPKFAITTGSQDSVECVLRKVGIDDAEFTNPVGGGRIQLLQADNSPGARIDAGTPLASTVLANSTALNSYDILMLPCEGSAYVKPAVQQANLVTYANSGGRVYGSHFAYEWLYRNAPFDTVANWNGNGMAIGTTESATVDPTFPGGATLTKWLQVVNAANSSGQLDISMVKQSVNGVNKPTQSWLTVDRTKGVAQFTFATPVGATSGQCGRILFNDYHVEQPIAGTQRTTAFPAECPQTATLTPQEKLLEYSLFDLANNGGPATMTPASADFGQEAVGFTTAPQVFTVTNNSVFAATLASATTTGDYLVQSNTCASVPAGGTCAINVAFRPTVVGTRPGTLSVTFGGTDLSATLTGVGVPAVSLSTATVDFGSVDVGATVNRVVTLTNTAPGPLPIPALTVTGDFKLTSGCPAVLPLGGSCALTITFQPTTTGPRSGTLTAAGNTGVTTAFTGNGVDFALAMNPTSDTVIAGLAKVPSLTTSPIAGFDAAVTLSCSTDAPATTCLVATPSIVPSTPVTTKITVTTTAQYALIGYGTSRGFLFIALTSASGLMVLLTRRRSRRLGHVLLCAILLGGTAAAMTGCSGKIPATNPAYTPPGTYTVTLTATDGFLVHTSTYSLKVTAR